MLEDSGSSVSKRGSFLEGGQKFLMFLNSKIVCIVGSKSNSENILFWLLLLHNKLPPKLSSLKQKFFSLIIIIIILSQEFGKRLARRFWLRVSPAVGIRCDWSYYLKARWGRMFKMTHSEG